MKNYFYRKLKLLFLLAIYLSLQNISLAQSSMNIGNDTVCQGETGVIYSVPLITNATNYTWILPSGALIVSGFNTNSITVNFSSTASSGNITVQGSNGCGIGTISPNFFVTVIALPQPSIISASGAVTICEGDNVILSGNNNGIWNNGEITSSIKVNKEGEYFVTNTNVCGSVNSNSIRIIINNCDVTDFFIPEGFSPNADGINDLFVIKGIENYPKNQFMIFNRWGNKVFEASPYNNNWNGTCTLGFRFGGDELPTGVYFYILDLGDGSKVYKGTITLNK